MTTQTSIFSKTWCEVIFYNRNHNYGAYQIRQESGKRHLLALFITFTFISVLLVIPKILPQKPIVDTPKITDYITVITKPPVQKTVDPIINTPKPRDLFKNFRPTIAFVAPVITNEVDENKLDTIPTMEKINNSGSDVASFNSEGNENGEKRGTDDFVPVPETDNTIYVSVGQMPQYPGGTDELFKYLKYNIKYPQLAVENGVSDNIFVQFVVFASGEIGNITVVRGTDESCKREAIRVIKNMPKWMPGKQNGNPVNVQMCLPVRFKLDNQ